MQKTSRRKLARYIAAQMTSGSADMPMLAKQVAAYLSEHKQLKSVELVMRDVSDVLAKEYGQVNVEVVSANSLSVDLREHIMRYAANLTGSDKIGLDESIDESLIGGAIIRLPGLELDSSVRTKLTKLRSV